MNTTTRRIWAKIDRLHQQIDLHHAKLTPAERHEACAFHLGRSMFPPSTPAGIEHLRLLQQRSFYYKQLDYSMESAE